jgi:hypothetical protein
MRDERRMTEGSLLSGAVAAASVDDYVDVGVLDEAG